MIRGDIFFSCLILYNGGGGGNLMYCVFCLKWYVYYLLLGYICMFF